MRLVSLLLSNHSHTKIKSAYVFKEYSPDAVTPAVTSCESPVNGRYIEMRKSEELLHRPPSIEVIDMRSSDGQFQSAIFLCVHSFSPALKQGYLEGPYQRDEPTQSPQSIKQSPKLYTPPSPLVLSITPPANQSPSSSSGEQQTLHSRHSKILLEIFCKIFFPDSGLRFDPNEDIGMFLKALGMSKYEETFRKEDISVDMITELSDTDLKELGMHKFPYGNLLI